MQSFPPLDPKRPEVIGNSGSKDFAPLLVHLKDVLEGHAFKGSHRSGQFLRYIVEQAVAGNTDSLKERVIGVELFGRSPSYDTGEDAIVRVTASDVRRRLRQHYENQGEASGPHISLPVGSYMPEFICSVPESSACSEPTESVTKDSEQLGTVALAGLPLTTPPLQDEVPDETESPEVLDREVPPSPARTRWLFGRRPWQIASLFLGLLALVEFGLLLSEHSQQMQETVALLNPWASFLQSTNALKVITSDPNIAEIQDLTGGVISISDYANHNYLNGPKKLTPEQEVFANKVLLGDKASTVDAEAVAAIARIAEQGRKSITVNGARNIQLSDLRTGDNFILLGSPRSNPWFNLYDDQLDFRFVNDTQFNEHIRNVRPHAGEEAAYIPTARGWATGQSFAIVALVKNPDQDGNVLLLAGENIEGTKAAGELVTDKDRFSAALNTCGVSASDPLTHFEMLLRLNTIAGLPNHVDVIACHRLS